MVHREIYSGCLTPLRVWELQMRGEGGKERTENYGVGRGGQRGAGAMEVEGEG